ncbi:MAG: agmatine deiminase family protein [Pseudomonadota bacterium]
MIDRRGFLAAMGGTMAASRAWSAANNEGWMLPEWVPHAACVMAWCSAFETYDRGEIAGIREEQARIARAIAQFEPLIMLANPGDEDAVARACGPNVRVITMDHYDTWTRDTLPVVGPGDRPGSYLATGWNFNAWGDKFEGYEDDRTLAARYASFAGLDFERASIVSEGGAFETDGRGTVVTTETCLLNPNRNPGMSRREVEDAIKAHAPCENVIWLWGSEVDEVTDGHVDGIMRFFGPDIVVVEVTDDKEDPEYAELQENAVRMEAARNARGDPYEVIRLNRPLWENMPERGPDFASSYVNSYFPNNGIVMPRFGDAGRDENARALFAELEPERTIVQLDIDQIAEGGGGIHCCTMQIPA